MGIRKCFGAGLGAALVAALLATSAHAATVGYIEEPRFGDIVYYTAGAGERNDADVRRGASVYFLISDPGISMSPDPARPPPPDRCVLITGLALCQPFPIISGQPYQPSGVAHLVAELGDGADKYRARGPVDHFRFLISGGDGNDGLLGSPGVDILDGGLGDDHIWGGPNGATSLGETMDRLTGGDGDDFIGARDGAPDEVTCGAGFDTVEADALDTVAADCEAVTIA